MSDPQRSTWLEQEREAQLERDADYRERFNRHMPIAWPCSYCGEILTDEACPCGGRIKPEGRS